MRLLPSCREPTPVVSPHGGSSLLSSYEDTNTIQEGPTIKTQFPPKDPPLNISLDIRFQYRVWAGGGKGTYTSRKIFFLRYFIAT